MVVLGAAIVSVLLFLLIPLTQILDPVKKVDLLIREVVLAPPPPNVPPPPPDDSEPLPEPPPPELVQVPPPITINALDIDLNAGTGDAIAIGVPSPDLVMQEVAQEIERMFTFDDLPEAPSLMNRPSFRFPPSLLRRGIKQGKVLVVIDILPNGRAEFVRIESATHDEFIPSAKRIVEGARFKLQKIEGRYVRVRGTFPLTLNSE